MRIPDPKVGLARSSGSACEDASSWNNGPECDDRTILDDRCVPDEPVRRLSSCSASLLTASEGVAERLLEGLPYGPSGRRITTLSGGHGGPVRRALRSL